MLRICHLNSGHIVHWSEKALSHSIWCNQFRSTALGNVLYLMQRIEYVFWMKPFGSRHFVLGAYRAKLTKVGQFALLIQICWQI